MVLLNTNVGGEFIFRYVLLCNVKTPSNTLFVFLFQIIFISNYLNG